MHEALELADRLFAAIEKGDLAGVAALYADDVVVWHNSTGLAQGRDENLRTLAWLIRHSSGRSYEHVRRSVTETGFVQQHVLRVSFDGRDDVSVPACLVAAVEAGKVTRIDEYLDSAVVARLLEHARGPR